MTAKNRVTGRVCWKMVARCPKCGQMHSVYSAELLAGKCAVCGTGLGAPAQYMVGDNLVRTKDVKAAKLVRVKVYGQKYLAA